MIIYTFITSHRHIINKWFLNNEQLYTSNSHPKMSFFRACNRYCSVPLWCIFELEEIKTLYICIYPSIQTFLDNSLTVFRYIKILRILSYLNSTTIWHPELTFRRYITSLNIYHIPNQDKSDRIFFRQHLWKNQKTSNIYNIYIIIDDPQNFDESHLITSTITLNIPYVFFSSQQKVNNFFTPNFPNIQNICLLHHIYESKSYLYIQ